MLTCLSADALEPFKVAGGGLPPNLREVRVVVGQASALGEEQLGATLEQAGVPAVLEEGLQVDVGAAQVLVVVDALPALNVHVLHSVGAKEFR